MMVTKWRPKSPHEMTNNDRGDLFECLLRCTYVHAETHSEKVISAIEYHHPMYKSTPHIHISTTIHSYYIYKYIVNSYLYWI